MPFGVALDGAMICDAMVSVIIFAEGNLMAWRFSVVGGRVRISGLLRLGVSSPDRAMMLESMVLGAIPFVPAPVPTP